ncbi:unnamed protein product [Macrosiphum euphorbiae]|uniref:Transposable element P transposase-like RNase H domain-containing protein n=2 Tax=Macrosiphum euphorbiae TaxID=13131 RepID=A0AAV0WAL5_9HEMI|nr:unnamed protein product [Macrosiphum euphorbiae]
MLNRIPFTPGINVHIEENLKYQATKLPNNNKKCAIIFDEMPLSAGLKYGKKYDMVFGIHKSENQAAKFEDHVIVFMLRGIIKKWKQPYAYYFCTNTTKTSDLVNYLETVIKSVNKTGFEIVATICDQGGTNRAAINHLISETNKKYTLINREKKCGF